MRWLELIGNVKIFYDGTANPNFGTKIAAQQYEQQKKFRQIISDYLGHRKWRTMFDMGTLEVEALLIKLYTWCEWPQHIRGKLFNLVFHDLHTNV